MKVFIYIYTQIFHQTHLIIQCLLETRLMSSIVSSKLTAAWVIVNRLLSIVKYTQCYILEELKTLLNNIGSFNIKSITSIDIKTSAYEAYSEWLLDEWLCYQIFLYRSICSICTLCKLIRFCATLVSLDFRLTHIIEHVITSLDDIFLVYDCDSSFVLYYYSY